MLCYKCDHSWNYKGKHTEGEGHITCPKCMYKIRVDKALMEDPSEQKLLTNLPKKRILPKKLPTTTSSKAIHTPLFTLSDLPEDEEELEDEIDLDKGIRIIKQDPDVRIIPIDPIKVLEHQQSYGFFGF